MALFSLYPMWLFGYKIQHIFSQYELMDIIEIYLTFLIYPMVVPRCTTGKKIDYN